MKDIAYVNGRFGSLEEATVSIEDRGFQFADGVYEVMVAPGGRPFRLREHFERLQRSARGIELHLDLAALGLGEVIADGIRRCGHADVLIYVQITRGVASRRHEFPDNIPPTVVATFKAKPIYNAELYKHGVALETVPDIRWARCSVKSIALLANVLIKNAAKRRGFYDAALVGADGVVRETSSANIFVVSNSAISTPRATEHILHGVTRAYILECAGRLDIPAAEVDFTVADLRAAQEVFISSTTIDVMPVTTIDDVRIGTGRPGPVSSRIRECFRAGLTGE